MEITSKVLAAFSVAVLALILRIDGQPGLSCTPILINSYTPCMNFLNNATANSTTPTPDCCNSLKSLTTNSSGCLCSFVSGNVPFPVPFNRTLAISLPQACNMPGVPVSCKATATAPVSAPGPASSTTPETTTPAAGSGGTKASSPSSATSSTSSPFLMVLGILSMIYA